MGRSFLQDECKRKYNNCSVFINCEHNVRNYVNLDTFSDVY